MYALSVILSPLLKVLNETSLDFLAALAKNPRDQDVSKIFVIAFLCFNYFFYEIVLQMLTCISFVFFCFFTSPQVKFCSKPVSVWASQSIHFFSGKKELSLTSINLQQFSLTKTFILFIWYAQ